MGALLIVNIYYYLEVEKTAEIYPNPKLLQLPNEMIVSVSPTSIGNINNYELL